MLKCNHLKYDAQTGRQQSDKGQGRDSQQQEDTE